MHHYGTSEDLELKGIFTEKMIKIFNIPFENVIKHGIIRLSNSNVDLYEVPPPYDKVTIFYQFWNELTLHSIVPKYYFTVNEIKKYQLMPVEENEIPIIICNWNISEFRNGKIVKESNEILFKYDRKNEEKYRLRFLMNPQFNPLQWEYEQSRKES